VHELHHGILKYYMFNMQLIYNAIFRLASVTVGLPDYYIYPVIGSTILKLQGFLDAAAYSATPMVLTKWKRKIMDWCRIDDESMITGLLPFGSTLRRSDKGGSVNGPPGGGPGTSDASPATSGSGVQDSSKGSSYFSYAHSDAYDD
jgi:hypothetical protein